MSLNDIIPVGHDAYRAVATLHRVKRKRPVAVVACSTLHASWWDEMKSKARIGDVVEVAINGNVVERHLVLGQGARILSDTAHLGEGMVMGTASFAMIPKNHRERLFRI